MGFWQGKCVVATGASGFIGSAVVERLRREKGVRIVRVARSLAAGPDAMPVALEDLERDVWLRHGVDNVDVLLHLGGFIPKSPAAGICAEENFASNLLGTQRLLESLPNVPQKIVFASSIDVYARTNEAIVETSPTAPATLYGASKLFLESLCTLYAAERGSDATVLRVGHVYGPGEGAFEKAIPNAIRALLQGRVPTVNGDGSALRDYLYLTDAAGAFVRAAELRGDAGPIDVVSGSSVSMRSLFETIAELAGRPGEIEYRADVPPGFSLRFDNRRFRDALGPLSLVPLRDGLAAEIAYFRELRDA